MTKVRSIVEGANARLLAEAAKLWIRPADLVVDVTYGRGLWWAEYRPARLVAHDLGLSTKAVDPDGVDFRQLPEADGSVDVVAFDPAYVAPGGRDTSTLAARGSDMWDRYGMATTPKNPVENAALIAQGVKEAARVLRPAVTDDDGIDPPRGRKAAWEPGGRLLAKAMDYVWGGHLQEGRRWVEDAARAAGLRKVDEFVHVGGPGPQPLKNPDGTDRRQVHSEHVHSFLLVFQTAKTVGEQLAIGGGA